MGKTLPHILVVDDDKAIRESLEAALKGEYVVHGAANSENAYATLRERAIAAVILDVVLGGENGLAVVDRFRKVSQAPILVLTGFGSETVAIHALRAGVNDYLKKPIDLAELRAAIARLVPVEARRLNAVAHVRHLLENRPDRPHTTASLAKDAGVSDRHLRRRFRDAYGKSLRSYLTEIRLQKAIELLQTTDMGIEQVALAAGYQDASAFGRLFKRTIGSSPTEWRTTHRTPGPTGPPV